MQMPRYVTEAIDAAASKGAARLDVRRQNWYLEIDPKQLNMGDSCMCVCGQLYGEYGPSAVAAVVGGWVNRMANVIGFHNVGQRYGFSVPETAETWADEGESTPFGDTSHMRYKVVWNRLERAWKNEIAARRFEAAMREAA